MPDPIFVTGTDTGVGKTLISTILAMGRGAHYWKPIQSGTNSPTDREWASKWINNDKIVPEVYRLTQPLSPHLSASLDDVMIDLNPIIAKYQDLPSNLIIEGAGGILTPLNETALMIDLVQRLDVACLVVARSILGTINHTLLTLEGLRRRNIPVLGVICVGDKNTENEKAIEFYGKTQVVGSVPWLEEISLNSLQTIYESFRGVLGGKVK